MFSCMPLYINLIEDSRSTVLVLLLWLILYSLSQPFAFLSRSILLIKWFCRYRYVLYIRTSLSFWNALIFILSICFQPVTSVEKAGLETSSLYLPEKYRWFIVCLVQLATVSFNIVQTIAHLNQSDLDYFFLGYYFWTSNSFCYHRMVKS